MILELDFGSVDDSTVVLSLTELDSPPESVAPELIAETLLRFCTTVGKKVLWSIESEILLDSQRRELIPCIEHVHKLNDRYNSSS
ncbi:hypothetical protein GGS24DRAFT_507486 [Hypoxylon argillaceum]|nr:hypothetical protein GGS24DRAFT_507486 [Hypoxylon argillaceum]